MDSTSSISLIISSIIIILLLIIGCVVYKYWWKNKTTGASLYATQADLDAAIMENEQGFGGDLGGNSVGFNPLATGFNPNAPAGFSNAPPGGGGSGFVRPVVERVCFRQEFGPRIGGFSGGGYSGGGGGGGGSSYYPTPHASSAGSNTIGLSFGGAKDINNFRKCIEQNIMPSIDSITYNGIFNDYYFDTYRRKYAIEYEHKMDEESMLFYPTYCYAKTQKFDFGGRQNSKLSDKDEREYYMTVGLNSNIKQDEFKRKHLNLVILLDVSGSMSDCFDNEIFLSVGLNSNLRQDLFKRKHLNLVILLDVSGSMSDCFDNERHSYNQQFGGMDGNKKVMTKMEAANECIIALLKHLTPNDKLGIVTFNNSGETLLKLQPVVMNDDGLIEMIRNTQAGGGTDFGAGYRKVLEIFESGEYKQDDEYDNRVIVVTDAQPTAGMRSVEGLMKLIKNPAEDEKKGFLPHLLELDWILMLD
eukprot:CAMPEP_0201595034 /NCGR_PEP_ID=MMETSP0190_2-20130828/192169_1 /ASSEMBLY_ACC=CAM_ASM_000263 /TAXON_ID=37353 /ORGANISM="Rosalina sp." /LENGTH=472 /DNA_ID=CAMNT_0048054881 /DNA_START=66 /DNA_END=1486 /DNA_ORIENTATION=-